MKARICPFGYVDNYYLFGTRYFIKAAKRLDTYIKKLESFENELIDSTWKGKTPSMEFNVSLIKPEEIFDLERDVISAHLDPEELSDDSDDENDEPIVPDDNIPEPVELVPAHPAEKTGAKKIGTFPSKNKKDSKNKDSLVNDSCQKKKLRTSEDIFNRIKWDPRYDSSDFLVCYEDRFAGLLEVPFDDFDTENIPFHRIWVIKQNGEVVWDRKNRIDKIFE